MHRFVYRRPAPAAPAHLTPAHAAYLAQVVSRQAQLQDWFCAHLPLGQPCTLELGSGHGHFLVAYAQAHPAAFCVGLELLKGRLYKAQRKAQRLGLQGRVHFIQAEAASCLALWPAANPLQRVYILFPDPWPKAKHAARRLVQPELVGDLARCMPAGGRVYVRTDDCSYAQWAQRCFAQDDRWRLLPPGPWDFDHQTYFHARALSQSGTEVFSLTFERGPL